MALRLKAKAAEVAVTTRTLQRWMAGHRAAGIAGLVDSRLVTKRSSTVDVLWDAACTEVLDDLTDASRLSPRGGAASAAGAAGDRSPTARQARTAASVRLVHCEYVVLDTTPLDVFAMEPVTLRWVRVELTVAMDPFTATGRRVRCGPFARAVGQARRGSA